MPRLWFLDLKDEKAWVPPVCDHQMGRILPGEVAQNLFQYTTCLYFYYVGSQSPPYWQPAAKLISRLLIKVTTGGSTKSELVSVLGGWLLSVSSGRFFSVISLHSLWIILNFYWFQILDTITCVGVHFPHSTEKLSCSIECWGAQNGLVFSPYFFH